MPSVAARTGLVEYGWTFGPTFLGGRFPKALPWADMTLGPSARSLNWEHCRAIHSVESRRHGSKGFSLLRILAGTDESLKALLQTDALVRKPE